MTMIPMTMIAVEPQPRIDSVVRLPGGGDARRTEYVGTVWFDGKPQVSGLMLRRAANAPRGIRAPDFSTSFFLPDSLAYHGAALGDAALSVSVVCRPPATRVRSSAPRRRSLMTRPVRRRGSRSTFTATWAGLPAWATASSRSPLPTQFVSGQTST